MWRMDGQAHVRPCALDEIDDSLAAFAIDMAGRSKGRVGGEAVADGGMIVTVGREEIAQI